MPIVTAGRRTGASRARSSRRTTVVSAARMMKCEHSAMWRMRFRSTGAMAYRPPPMAAVGRDGVKAETSRAPNQPCRTKVRPM